MKKDFITATPDSGGSGSTTVTATAPANQTESARSTSLSVAGGGMTRTVGASQAAGVVTWNYYFSVTPTSLSFVVGGETKSVTVTSYRKKVINGVETSTQENVNWTPTVSGTGFSVSGSNVTASANSATTTRSGTATYTQTGSGKTQAVSLSQAAAVSSTWTYPWYLNNKGGFSMQSFYIYLDLYNGSGIIDSIVIHGGGMGSGGGIRKGTYTTRVQSNGTWKIRSVVVESTTYTADQFFNTLGGRFAYGETEPTGTVGKNNGVGNYYHSLGFWFKTT